AAAPAAGAPAQSPGTSKKIVVVKTEDPFGESVKAAAPAKPAPEKPVAEEPATLKVASKPPVKPGPAIAPPATSTRELAVAAAGKIELNIVKPEETKKAKVT